MMDSRHDRTSARAAALKRHPNDWDFLGLEMRTERTDRAAPLDFDFVSGPAFHRFAHQAHPTNAENHSVYGSRSSLAANTNMLTSSFNRS